MDLTSVDAEALDRLLAAAPAWTGIATAADVTGQTGRVLLHSGPPAEPSHAQVQPTLNSAAVACVFEGWADDLDAADALIAAGGMAFAPAQDHGVATPLAAHPLRRIVVPVVAGVGDAAKRRFDVVPAPFIVESPLNQFSDEGATLPGAGPPVEFGHEIVVERDVQSHGPNLAHSTHG